MMNFLVANGGGLNVIMVIIKTKQDDVFCVKTNM